MLNEYIIRTAIEQAKQSSHKMRVGACLFEKKWILSAGRNYACRSAKHLHPRFSRWRGSVHAEIAAVLSARCDLKGASILVIRLNNRDEFRLAKPCQHCWAYLEFVGIKYCFYSTNDGNIMREKID